MSIPVPTANVAIALASIAVHVEEANEIGGHTFDVSAAKSLLHAPGVRDYIAELDALALVPRKRSADQ